MINKQMYKRYISFITLLLLVASVCVGCSNRMVMAVMDNVAAATAPVFNSAGNPYEDPNDPNIKEGGVCISTDTETGYFMEIKLTNQTTAIIDPKYESINGFSGTAFQDWGGKWVWSDVYHDCTAILTFVDLKYYGHPVYVGVFTKVLYKNENLFTHPRMWFQEDLTEANGKAIRIPASYYNFIKYEQANKGISLNRFNVTFMKNNGKDVIGLKYAQEVEVRLYTKDIPADSDEPVVKDPITGETVWNPNFTLDNWAGIMSAATKAKSGCDSFMAWLENNWLYVVIGIAAIVAICILIKFLRWAFGKK